jgi:hypothetical protein
MGIVALHLPVNMQYTAFITPVLRNEQRHDDHASRKIL